MATSAVTTVELVRVDEPLGATERGAIAGFLAGYTGNTLISYTTDLRLFVQWCTNNDLPLFDVRRAHLEIFGRQMEANGRMRSTVARRLSTLGSFYRYCHVEGILERNPAANVRHPKVDTESRTLGLDRNELGGLLVQAGLGSPRDHALISLLALNGLRISEALGADIDAMDMDRWHRTLAIVRKGGKHVVIPLAPRTGRTLDLYIDERTTGPIFLGQRSAHGPLRRGPDRESTCEAGRDHRADLAAQPAALVHHRRTRRRRPTPRRARSRQPRGPANDDALRPCPPIVGPARDLHRRSVRRRSITHQLTTRGGRADHTDTARHRRLSGGSVTGVDMSEVVHCDLHTS